jgi:integrase
LTQNDNSETAKTIREFKANVGFLKIRDQIENNKIDLNTLDPDIQDQALMHQNEELLTIAKKNEQEKQISLERKLKRQNAKELKRRDYISPEEFYDTVDKIVFRCEDSRYLTARQRVAFFIMYFTRLRDSNLLLMTRRHIHELVNKSFTELPIIKRRR